MKLVVGVVRNTTPLVLALCHELPPLTPAGCCAQDYVVERGIVLSDGRQLVYKQPEQAFSNPNGGMAIHTLDWLSSCAHTIRGARKQLRPTAGAPPGARRPRAPPRQVIPPLLSLFTLLRPYLAHFFPVFSRFLRVFTVSTRRFQRAPSRNPGPSNGGKNTKTRDLGPSFDTPDANQRINWRVPKARNVRGVLLLVLDGGRLLRLPASGRAAERGWGWDLPGSAVAEGETAEAAAERVLATAVDERARRRYEYRGGAHLASTKSQLFVYGSVGGGGACAVGGAEWVDLDGAALGASYRLRQVQREPKLRRLHCG
eukprot:COSAG04_NODE_2356_length_4279_cov_2.681818_5_plen_314_part_00